jgi:hypothetical protein
MGPVVGPITHGAQYGRTLRSNIERRWVPDERIHEPATGAAVAAMAVGATVAAAVGASAPAATSADAGGVAPSSTASIGAPGRPGLAAQRPSAQ